MRRCFLDMDGVLVNFVGGACRFHCVDNPYENKDNWGKYDVDKLVGMSKKDFFDPLDEEFWATLPPTVECFSIVEVVERAFGPEQVCILTSPVRTPGCAEGKIRWLKTFLPQYKRRFFIGPPKEFAASKDAWLIDDSDTNCETFAKWGGNCIAIPRPWNKHHAQSGRIMDLLISDLTEYVYADLRLPL